MGPWTNQQINSRVLFFSVDNRVQDKIGQMGMCEVVASAKDQGPGPDTKQGWQDAQNHNHDLSISTTSKPCSWSSGLQICFSVRTWILAQGNKEQVLWWEVRQERTLRAVKVSVEKWSGYRFHTNPTYRVLDVLLDILAFPFPQIIIAFVVFFYGVFLNVLLFFLVGKHSHNFGDITDVVCINCI